MPHIIKVLSGNNKKIKIRGTTETSYIKNGKKEVIKREDYVVVRTMYIEYWNECKVSIVWYGGKEYIVHVDTKGKDVFTLGRCITI